MGAGASLQGRTEKEQLEIYKQIHQHLESITGQLTESQLELHRNLSEKFFVKSKQRRSTVENFTHENVQVSAQNKERLLKSLLGSSERNVEASSLMVGDIVRVPDTTGATAMWFEGMLVKVEGDVFTVEMEDGHQEEVNSSNIRRVQAWHHLELGDAVECRPDGQGNWFAGIITCVDNAPESYSVHIGGDEEPEHGLRYDQLRKVMSVRSQAALRWHKAFRVVNAVRTFAGSYEKQSSEVPPNSSR